MTIRERLEQLEMQRLAPWATRSAEYAQRAFPISEDNLRTSFQRDRDRILHAKSFRRLKHKTQCFLAPEGDHYRTRLTHTLEVSQIARTLARALWLNEDLAEAIALGHDLGHTPFGHMGERILNRLMPGGFSHRLQSLRVVSVLERDGQGLNLTEAVREGILHHSGEVAPKTLEGQCVVVADRIAYVNHDIDDGMRAGVLRAQDIPGGITAILGDSHGVRINTMVCDIVHESDDGQSIRMSGEIAEAMEQLRDFLFAHVYMRPEVLREEEKTDRLLTSLFGYLCGHPEAVPDSIMKCKQCENMEGVVCDYIAGMTDRYAKGCFERAFIPSDFARM